MATITLDTIVQELLPETQNIPSDTVKVAIIQTVRNFCIRSRVWRIMCACTVNQYTGHITLPTGSELIECEYIKVKCQKDVINKPVVLDSLNGVVDVSEEHIMATVSSGYSICSIMPKSDITLSLDETLYRRWQSGLRNGILFELRSQFGREWYEPNIALVHREGFELELAKAAHQAMNKYLKSPAKSKKSGWL